MVKYNCNSKDGTCSLNRGTNGNKCNGNSNSGNSNGGNSNGGNGDPCVVCPPGATGAIGPQGPIGPKGCQWFVRKGLDNPLPGEPQPHCGDLMLNTCDCQVYKFKKCPHGTCQWIPTGQYLNCVNCEDIYACLKKLDCFCATLPCTVSWQALDGDPLFTMGGPKSISEILINCVPQPVPVGTFSSPEELAALLAPFGWEYNAIFNTNFYVIQYAGPITKISRITFNDGTRIQMSCECPNAGECDCGCPDLERARVLICKDGELFWVDKDCLSGPTGGTGPSGITGPTGPAGPTGPSDCAIVADCLCQLERTGCPDPTRIHQVLIKNAEEQLQWIELFKCLETSCQPNQLACCLEQFPDCGDVEFNCYLKLNPTDAFACHLLNAKPWQITEFILNGEDKTTYYNTPFNTIQELEQILLGNGWIEDPADSGCFRYLFKLATLGDKETSRWSVIDNNGVVFLCDQITCNCEPIDCEELKMLFRIGEKDFCLDGPKRIFDCLPLCGFEYQCRVIIDLEDFITFRDLPGGFADAGQIRDWILFGEHDLELEGTHYQDLGHLMAILAGKGWVSIGNNQMQLDLVRQEQTNQDGPNIAVFLGSIINPPNPISFSIPLQVGCTGVCLEGFPPQVGGGQPGCEILARKSDGECCWTNPCCVYDLNGKLCQFPECPEEAIENLCLETQQCILDQIVNNFGGLTGNYEIMSFRLVGGTAMPINQAIADPLTLEKLGDAFVAISGQSWTVDELTPTSLRVRWNPSTLQVTHVLINQIGNDPEVPPLPFYLPINCSNPPGCALDNPDNRVLIKRPDNSFCWGAACRDPTEDLCHLPTCPDQFKYNICIEILECHLELINQTYATGATGIIEAYQLDDGTQVTAPPLPEFIGLIPISENELQQAFESLGWSVTDEIDPNVLFKATLPEQCELITQIKINGLTDQQFGPAATCLPTNCTRISNCAHEDPENKHLIKKADGSVCWAIPCPKTEHCLSMCGDEDHVGIRPIGDLSDNASLSVGPRGTGFLSAQKPTPGDPLGGDCRGPNAVDWQTSRNAATQVAAAPYSNINGGERHRITEQFQYSNIAGGQSNEISAGPGVTGAVNNYGWNHVAGGANNRIRVEDEANINRYNSIGGGSLNNVSNFNASGTEISSSLISGGFNNEVFASGNGFTIQYASIGGGFRNVVGAVPLGTLNNSSVRAATISGGFGNFIRANADNCTVNQSTIGGGVSNRVEANDPSSLASGSTIAGGEGNDIQANNFNTNVSDSTIGGGFLNDIVATEATGATRYATVAGGAFNRITDGNEAGTIPGGIGLELVNQITGIGSGRFACGRYNNEGSTGNTGVTGLSGDIGPFGTSMVDRVFVVGDGAAADDRSNVFSIDNLGDVRTKMGGSYTSMGADYAEYFESKSGTAIPPGTSVVIDSDTGLIQPATGAAGEQSPIGIITKTAGTIGNAADEHWSGKYLTDEWGGLIYEQVEVKREIKVKVPIQMDMDDLKHMDQEKLDKYKKNPFRTEVKTIKENLLRPKLNPAYNPGQSYQSRVSRQEWNLVSLLGQVRLRKGQPTHSTWIKIKNLSDTVELWLVK